jgi:preprotein translocase subunit YajC
METLAYAADAAKGAQGASGLSGMLFPLVLMFAVFYFLLIRPQQKKQKQHDQMLKSLNKGDKVITSGGLYGIVSKVTDKDVILEVADKVSLRFTLGAIGTIREREGAKEDKEAD